MLPLSLSSPYLHSYLPNSLSLTTNNPRFHVSTKNSFTGGGITSPEEVPFVTPAGLAPELMPKHLAVIMDGNRRWARSRGLMSKAGHMAGAKTLKVVMDLCRKWGIQALTAFVFSSENWLRSKVETDLIMWLSETSIKDEIAYMLREDIRLSIIEDLSRLPQSFQEFITYAEHTTKNNSRLHLVIAINYSGKYDIIQACQSIGLKVKDGVVEPKEIDEVMIDNELVTNFMSVPHPDLVIRTSGEVRVSNFFLWQMAYSELYFTETLWPDFGEDELLRALHTFQNRVRRYGG